MEHPIRTTIPIAGLSYIGIFFGAILGHLPFWTMVVAVLLFVYTVVAGEIVAAEPKK